MSEVLGNTYEGRNSLLSALQHDSRLTAFLWTTDEFGFAGPVNSVAFSPDGKKLASGGDDIRLWDIASRKPIGEPLSNKAAAVAFSPDGKTFATHSMTKLRFGTLPASRLIGEKITVPDYVTSIVFSPDGKLLASGGTDKKSFSGTSPVASLLAPANRAYLCG